MKNAFFLAGFIVLTFIGTASFGQSINIRAGFTNSNLKSPAMTDTTYGYQWELSTYYNEVKYSSISGYHVALTYEFPLGDRLSLETGLKYQERGYQMEVIKMTTHDVSYWTRINHHKYKLRYIDLPIILNTAIVTGDFKVYARTGIYLGLLMQTKYTNQQVFTSNYLEEGISSAAQTVGGNKLDFDYRNTGGFILGLGTSFKGICFEANYNIGAYQLAYMANKAYTHDLSFSLGYKIEL